MSSINKAMARATKMKQDSYRRLIDGWIILTAQRHSQHSPTHTPAVRFIVPLPYSPVKPPELYAAKLIGGVLHIRPVHLSLHAKAL